VYSPWSFCDGFPIWKGCSSYRNEIPVCHSTSKWFQLVQSIITDWWWVEPWNFEWLSIFSIRECHHPNWRAYFSEGWLNHQTDNASPHFRARLSKNAMYLLKIAIKKRRKRTSSVVMWCVFWATSPFLRQSPIPNVGFPVLKMVFPNQGYPQIIHIILDSSNLSDSIETPMDHSEASKFVA